MSKSLIEGGPDAGPRFALARVQVRKPASREPGIYPAVTSGDREGSAPMVAGWFTIARMFPSAANVVRTAQILVFPAVGLCLMASGYRVPGLNYTCPDLGDLDAILLLNHAVRPSSCMEADVSAGRIYFT